jgi:hypothetical protein
MDINHFGKSVKQAGAELRQAQEKLGIATPTLPSKKLWSSSCSYDIEVLFHLPKKLGCLPLAKKLISSSILPRNFGCLQFNFDKVFICLLLH